ncbi:OB-fold nucleic acid binding domain-containing protein [Candidatus Wolfebacteria bacterium]|nr:OB-fold nucleic acid binding domain-containing protein [Candidatus Wolfebacteria bacterium]
MQNRVHIGNLKDHIGSDVVVAGWVHVRRDHGKLIFIDLRDETGKIQIVFNPKVSEGAHTTAESLRSEWVVSVTGIVKERPDNLINKEEPNGALELAANGIEIVNEAKTPPFDVTEDTSGVGEEARLKYRYIDLRSERMQRNMRKRSEVVMYIRNFLVAKSFTEIETPILTKSTPEGARDFLVPSRLQQGKFYALPQSPQQYKQLLIASGFEKYFQIPRCFRDEDPRADRAYGEFTQLDIEMAFVEQEDILKLTEELFTTMVESVFPEKRITKKPWPRLTHKEAIAQHQTDKPDLRANTSDPNELAFAWTLDFPLFAEQTKEDFFHGSGKATFAPSHHMFTAPHPDDIPLLDTDPMNVRGLQHDMVLNGYEVGGGSIRIHDPNIQTKIFELIGFTEEQKKEFRHMLEAFTYGVPPHGGIAPGIDRLLMVILGEPNLREVIAFPATSGGQAAVMDAPSEVAKEQLTELGIEIKEKKE